MSSSLAIARGPSKTRTIAHMMMTSKDNVDILTWEDDELRLEATAQHSRLPYDKLTTHEVACFPDVSRGAEATHKVYLYLRNKTLQLWFRNCSQELTVEYLLKEIPEPYNSDSSLITRIHAFLCRYGYINFGYFTPAPEKIENKRKNTCNVIIIGAGVAGLSAAPQLKSFGCTVTVFEARDRVGGRVATFKKGSFVADLGAMIVTGLGGSPIAVLARQMPMTLQKVKMKCPIFDINGKPVELRKDSMIESEFNRLLDASAYLTHTENVESIGGKKLALGDSIELLIKHQEKRVKERKLEFWQTIVELLEKQKELQKEMLRIRDLVERLHKEYTDLVEGQNERAENAANYVKQFEIRSKRRDLNTAIRTFDKLEKTNNELALNIQETMSSTPSDVYMNALDRRILDWHMANLEFANATSLHNLSIKHWDQDDEYEFTGAHLNVREGYGVVPNKLADGLNIHLSTAVREVKYSATGVEVTTAKVENNIPKSETDTLTADVCLCTIPLGVLKQSVLPNPTQNKAIDFNPSLPDWKVQAIERHGFGNLNKIVLCFDRIFWDTSTNLFGHLNQTTQCRGEMFLFWAIYDAPTLIALVAGEAADAMENISDNILVGRCIKVLTDIFGNTVPQEPKEAVVTRWRSDPWARGSYSFVAVGSSGETCEALTAPVSESGSSSTPRLFFAGEHTNRNYPATVHGAMLSGFREAGRIAEQFLGCPYGPITDDAMES